MHPCPQSRLCADCAHTACAGAAHCAGVEVTGVRRVRFDNGHELRHSGKTKPRGDEPRSFKSRGAGNAARRPRPQYSTQPTSCPQAPRVRRHRRPAWGGVCATRGYQGNDRKAAKRGSAARAPRKPAGRVTQHRQGSLAAGKSGSKTRVLAGRGDFNPKRSCVCRA